MSAELISKAVLLALNTEATEVPYDCLYGGETLLNRALIALSKSGVQFVKIICRDGQQEKISLMVNAVRARVSCDCEILALRSTDLLSETIALAVKNWDEAFFLFATDKIVHPTFFVQAREFKEQQKPLLFAYKNVWLNDGQVVFVPAFPEKFRVIFHRPIAFTKIALAENVFQETTFALATAHFTEISPELKTGIISTDIVTCRRSDFHNMAANNFAEILQFWNTEKLLTIGFLEKFWWLKVTGKENKEQVKEFFWKIAFKEISGEFSKLVNSRLSKPLTFLFVRLGFSPNAISVIELLLFFVASLFLLINHYWAVVIFAVIWQFAAGVLDRCDGETARVRNYESEAGGRIDMLIDDLRFGLPFVFLTVACYREFQFNPTYIVVAAVTLAWYGAAAILHTRFIHRAGYVSMQAMGEDFFKAQEGAWVKPYRRIQPFIKGDIRTFYLFLLSFLGRKNVLFWTLVVYAWPLGASYFFTIKKFRFLPQRVEVNT